MSTRKFESGATRDADTGKFDYEGFFSPLVLERRALYMNKHRVQSDGRVRESDNWMRGIPLNAYMKSAFRHFVDWWKEHRGVSTRDGLEDALCALLFNAEGYLHELLKRRQSNIQVGLENKQRSGYEVDGGASLGSSSSNILPPRTGASCELP